LLDSLSINSFLRGTRIADIGTGAGFPGLPLALINPDKQFTLIDSVAKKLRFVDSCRAVDECGQRVDLACARGVDRSQENNARRFDCVIARAVGKITTVVEASGHLLGGGGRLLAMKASDRTKNSKRCRTDGKSRRSTNSQCPAWTRSGILWKSGAATIKINGSLAIGHWQLARFRTTTLGRRRTQENLNGPMFDLFSSLASSQ